MAEARTIHLLVTHEGDAGWSVQSPQVPGFVMGRSTVAEVRADLPEALTFAGAQWDQLQVHMVRRFATPEGDEYTIRVAEDAHRGDRLEVAWRLEAVMATEQRHDLLRARRARTGELAFVCAVASDRLGWFTEQLDDEDDVVTLAGAVADEGVLSTQLAGNPDLAEQGWESLDELGWDADTTFGQLMRLLAAPGDAPRLVVSR